MANFIIKNENLEVVIRSLGAEIISMKDQDGNEYLWQGDPAYWDGQAPNLFPYIGRMVDKKYTFEGKTYDMEIHGFAKDSEFKVNQISENEIVFSMTDSEETYKQYPFHFEFDLMYKVLGTSLQMCYLVKNLDEKEMYFGVGAHPGINVPFENGTKFEDYYLEFTETEDVQRVKFSDDCFVEGENPYELRDGKYIDLRHDLFDEDAIVLRNMSKNVLLTSKTGTKAVQVTYPRMDYVGFWHWPKKDAPYVCIEPWSSLPSRKGPVEDIAKQPGLVKLAPKQVHMNPVTLTIIDKEKPMLKTAPVVFAVENEYQIMVYVNEPCLFWVKVGEEEYYDESNGIMRSMSEIHRVSVPMEALDQAGSYTVCVRPIIERKPYFTETEPVMEYTYAFYPVKGDKVRAYHIADGHNHVAEPIAAAKAYGDVDFLILNGDDIDHSGDPSKFEVIYQICDGIVGGTKPVIFSRGNHDLRGNFAEGFAQYTPNYLGNTYYKVRLGNLWFVLLDCGEDKPDDHPEYGFTVACHVFRKRQTAFLKKVLAEKSFEAEGISHRMVITHNPFTYVIPAPFDIEQDIYKEWIGLLNEMNLDALLAGHLHEVKMVQPGDEYDSHKMQKFPAIIASLLKGDYYAGCGLEFSPDGIEVTVTDSEGKIVGEKAWISKKC